MSRDFEPTKQKSLSKQNKTKYNISSCERRFVRAYENLRREGVHMPTVTSDLVKQYVELLSKIYGDHLKTVILYGSYARGDYTEDSDIDIMVLLDLSDMDIKKYRHELSGMTYDFNMDYDLEIKPIAKNKEHFNKWVDVYPFYANIEREGVKLFDAA